MTAHTNSHLAPQASAFALSDIYYMLFRHKWKILICSTLGLMASVAIYLFTPISYRSEAKLLVRYVTESAAVDPEITGRRTLTPDTRGDSVINTELYILTSQDVIGTVIEQIGQHDLGLDEGSGDKVRDWLVQKLKRLLPGAATESGEKENEQRRRSRVAQMITEGLQVNNPKNTNVINLEYYAPSPSLAQRTLKTLIDAYLTKHYAIHRSLGAYEFLAQQVDQTRSSLSQTEEELRTLIAKAGYSSANEAEAALSARRTAIQQQVWQLEGELAGTLAQSKIMEQWIASGGSFTRSAFNVGLQDTSSMDSGLISGTSLSALRRREETLLSTFTEDSTPIKDLRSQIDRLAQRAALPMATNLTDTAPMDKTDTPLEVTQSMGPELINVQARIASIQARIKALKNNLSDLENRTENQQEMLGRIDELQRKKEIEEANYRYFSQSLEQAKIDASLDAEKLANISIVQPPTYPARLWRGAKFKRNVFGALVLGVLAGLGLAFFTEKIADTSIRQPAQVETALSTPLLLTIPQSAFSRRTLSMRQGDGTVRMLPAHAQGEGENAIQKHDSRGRSWTLQSKLNPYFEALRDRVVTFEKEVDGEGPCIVGLTGCRHGSGTTTMAAGLALALARNGDGRVLFMDLSELDHRRGNSLLEHAEKVRIADIFADDSGRTTIMQPNLFVLPTREVSDDPQEIKPSRRVEDVISQLQSSEYDYVVLDMPPIAETSPSLRIAPLISGVILIIEAEKVAKTTAQKARKLLDQSRSTIIGAILNRKKQYVPGWLEQGS